MRVELVSWINDEVTQAWPWLIAVVPVAALWLRKRWRAFKAGVLQLIRDSLNEAAELPQPAVEDLAAIRQDVAVARDQLANDHSSNLRHDIDDVHSTVREVAADVKAMTTLTGEHLRWSQEWTERIERQVDGHDAALVDHAARIAALEAAAANPSPPGI